VEITLAIKLVVSAGEVRDMHEILPLGSQKAANWTSKKIKRWQFQRAKDG
jgi:hypothetical protein